MVKHARSLALLMTVAVAACDRPTAVDASNLEAGVLPATEGSKDFGDYVVFFNALTTDQLTPDIAAAYGIVRSKSRALLNVSVHRKQPNGVTTAVNSTVNASAVNLNGQLKNMTLREVTAETAIYYLGELAVTDAEALIFTVEAKPNDAASPFTIRFEKQFFVPE